MYNTKRRPNGRLFVLYKPHGANCTSANFGVMQANSIEAYFNLLSAALILGNIT